MTMAPFGLRRGPATTGILLGLVLAAGALTAGYYYLWRQPPGPDGPTPPGDPRTAYRGPFRNISADVRYLGDSACANCHADECEQFHQHAMGRSILPTAAWLNSNKAKP